MASLLAATSGGPTPLTSLGDKVRTLALVETIYRSARAGVPHLRPRTGSRLAGPGSGGQHLFDQPHSA